MTINIAKIMRCLPPCPGEMRLAYGMGRALMVCNVCDHVATNMPLDEFMALMKKGMLPPGSPTRRSLWNVS